VEQELPLVIADRRGEINPPDEADQPAVVADVLSKQSKSGRRHKEKLVEAASDPVVRERSKDAQAFKETDRLAMSLDKVLRRATAARAREQTESRAMERMTKAFVPVPGRGRRKR
jgi:hypothetical protein